MDWVVGFALIAIAVALVVRPLIGTKAFAPFPKRSSLTYPREQLRERKALILLALRELDFDFEMGKLSKEDYLALRDQYQRKGVEVMKEIDSLEETWKTVQSDIDRELNLPEAAKKTISTYCPSCGTALGVQDRYCGRCGTATLQAQAHA